MKKFNKKMMIFTNNFRVNKFKRMFKNKIFKICNKKTKTFNNINQ